VQSAEDRHRLDPDTGRDAQATRLEAAVELGDVGDRFALVHAGSIRASVNRAGRNPFPFAAEYEYSQSVVVDGALVFTAGQGGFGEDGTVVDPDDAEAQIRKAFENLEQVLEPEGASLATVVKMTVYLARASDYDAFKRARHDAFSPPYPASTAIVAGGFLFDGMLVEIDAVARVGERRA
jgi:2-iminobutanoate/2-iminopropanoate deaminase